MCYAIETAILSIAVSTIKVLTREQMPFTTVAQQLNQGTLPKTGRFRFRVAFFRSFLAKQKRTKKIMQTG
jgi:hypothetical protein